MPSVVSGILLGMAGFVVMEPVTAATHRWVMHGIGARLHRSHHRVRPGRWPGRWPGGWPGRWPGRWEANDAFPVMFAAVVCVGFWVGFNRPGFAGLVPIGVGVTLYGLAYAVVHDVYIHGRVRWFGARRVAVLDRLAAAHRIHHLYGGAPYGMLLPVVPADLRARAERTARDPLRERVAPSPRA